MITFRARTWTGLGAAVLLGAGGLAACSGEGEGGEAGQAPAAGAPAAQGGEGEGGEGEAGAASSAETGAETGGEQGAQAAYGSIPTESRRALRLAHLKGFFLAAEAVRPTQGAEAAAALAGQGMLEVFDPARGEIATASFNEAALRRAAETGDPGALRAAIASLDAAQREAGGDPAAVARGLTAITVGLHRETTAGGAIDPVEYQHAYGAALALRDLGRREAALSSARGDIDRLAGLWRSPVAPETPASAPTLAQVQAQASRVELALSGA